MKTHEKVAAALGAAFLIGIAAFSGAWDWTRAKQFQDAPDASAPMLKAQTTVLHWPEDTRLLAQNLMEELGAPEEIMPHYLSWFGVKPFNAITVFADRSSANQPGVLMHSVSYHVPVTQWRNVAAFGHGVLYDVVFNELVVYSDSVETNLLALNLADEVLQNRRTVVEAQGVYDKTLQRSLAGRSSPLMKSLRFNPKDRVAK